MTNKALTDFVDDVGVADDVVIEGGHTRWETGGLPDPAARLVKAPAGIVGYAPEEMTVTVGAGTSVADLHAELGTRGQRTALPERGGTVGGALAVGQNDWAVLAKGTVRATLLQVKYVSAEGKLVKGGGPTVKNVTGFDIPRLMVGSLGTLGCLGEVVLRTNPIPAVQQWFTAQDVDPFAVPSTILAPAAVVWNGRNTWVCLEGHAVDVKAEALALDRIGPFLEGEPPPEQIGHRWSVAPSELRSVHPAKEATGFALGDTPLGEFTALIGVGTIVADQAQPERQLPKPVAAVHARMKQLFDPTGRLNPGRDPAGGQMNREVNP